MKQSIIKEKKSKCEVSPNSYKNTLRYLSCNPDCYNFYRLTNFTCTHLFCTKHDRVTDLYTNLGFEEFEKQSTVGPCPQCGNKTIWLRDLPEEVRPLYKDRHWNLSHTSFRNRLMLLYTCNKCNEKDGIVCRPFKISCFNSLCTYEVDRISKTKQKIGTALVLLTKLPIQVRT